MTPQGGGGFAAAPLWGLLGSLKYLKDILKCPPDIPNTFVGPFRLARDIFVDIFLAHPRKGSWDILLGHFVGLLYILGLQRSVPLRPEGHE